MEEPLDSVKVNVLQEASHLVRGDRCKEYLHPYADYLATAAIWTALIEKRYNVIVPLSPDFCCLMMSAMKLSREAGKHKRDNLVDAAGYVLCADMCLEVQGG